MRNGKRLLSILIAAVFVFALVPVQTVLAEHRPGDTCPICGEEIEFSYEDEFQHKYACVWVNLPAHSCYYYGFEDHFGGKATCTSAPVCEACGFTYGSPLGHDWILDTEQGDGGWEWADDGSSATVYLKCQRDDCSETAGFNDSSPQKESMESEWKFTATVTQDGKTFTGTHTIQKPTVTITAKVIDNTYNGEFQGPGDTAYDDAEEIAEWVAVEGLQGTDRLAGIVIDGGGKDVGPYTLTPSAAEIRDSKNEKVNDNYNIIYVEGTLNINPGTYTITDGAGGTWTRGSGTDYSLTVKRSEDDASCFSYYEKTLIDGEETTVSAKPGSTVVTVPADTLEALSAGDHTVTVQFADGKAETTLTVEEPTPSPSPSESPEPSPSPSAEPSPSPSAEPSPSPSAEPSPSPSAEPSPSPSAEPSPSPAPEPTAAPSPEPSVSPPPSPAPSVSPAPSQKPTSPQTGDDTNPMLWMWLMTASLIGLVALWLLGKKHNVWRR